MTQIQLRRGSAASWTSSNPILAIGEVGYETDTLRSKIGNGTTAWNSLAYWQSAVSFVQTIGNGSATAITVTHNLNTRNVLVSVKRSSTNAEVEVDVVATTVNAVTLTFATAPTTNEFYVTVVSAGAATVSNALSNPLVTNSGVSLTLPTSNTTLVGTDTIQTISNKTISGSGLNANTFTNIPTSALTLSGAKQAFVDASQTLSSPLNTWTDLPNTSDSVTVTIGSSGIALVMLKFYGYNNNASFNYAMVSVALSGANTSGPINERIIRVGGGSLQEIGGSFICTGLVAGSTTFKMKYLTTAATAIFGSSYIAVVPL